MKETLRKEERVGQETKRNYVATHLDLEKILLDYQVLEAEKDSLELSNTILDGETKELERKVEDMEIQRSTTDKKAEKSKVLIVELEAKNSSVDILLKVANERKMDIEPLREHALFLRGKIYQVQVKLEEEVYRIKQVESRLQEISVISIEFKTKIQEIA